MPRGALAAKRTLTASAPRRDAVTRRLRTVASGAAFGGRGGRRGRRRCGRRCRRRRRQRRAGDLELGDVHERLAPPRAARSPAGAAAGGRRGRRRAAAWRSRAGRWARRCRPPAARTARRCRRSRPARTGASDAPGPSPQPALGSIRTERRSTLRPRSMMRSRGPAPVVVLQTVPRVVVERVLRAAAVTGVVRARERGHDAPRGERGLVAPQRRDVDPRHRARRDLHRRRELLEPRAAEVQAAVGRRPARRRSRSRRPARWRSAGRSRRARCRGRPPTP